MNRISQREIGKRYSEIAGKYDFFTFFMEIFIGRLRKRLLSKARGKVLEIGAGTGRNLEYYPKECIVTLSDYSPEMLEKAKLRAGELKRKVNFRIANAEKLPFKKEQFDTVVDTLGLCTYPNPIKVLRELKRVCKKKGKFLFLEHGISNRNFIKNLQNKREEKHYQKAGCNLTRNPAELVRKAGFSIEKIERRVFGIFYIIKMKK